MTKWLELSGATPPNPYPSYVILLPIPQDDRAECWVRKPNLHPRDPEPSSG